MNLQIIPKFWMGTRKLCWVGVSPDSARTTLCPAYGSAQKELYDRAIRSSEFHISSFSTNQNPKTKEDRYVFTELRPLLAERTVLITVARERCNSRVER